MTIIYGMSKEFDPEPDLEHKRIWTEIHEAAPNMHSRLSKIVGQLGMYRFPNRDHIDTPDIPEYPDADPENKKPK